jgi:hypothetical protein
MSNSITVIHGDLSPEKMTQKLVWDSDYRAGGVGWGLTVDVPNLPKAAAAVVRRYRVAKELVNDGDRYGYNQNWMAEKRQMLKEWATDEVNGLRDALKKAADAHMAKFPAPSTEVDEGKAMRVWNRLQRQLDAGVTLGDVVNNASAEELQILSEEIGGYYRATIPDERAAKGHTEGAQQLIDQRWAVIDPAAAKQIASRREAEQGIRNVEGAFNWAEHAIENDYVGELLGYAPQSTVTI